MNFSKSLLLHSKPPQTQCHRTTTIFLCSQGQELGQGSAGWFISAVQCLRRLEYLGVTKKPGCRIYWRLLHSYVPWLEDLKVGLSWSCLPEHLQCSLSRWLGLHIAWQLGSEREKPQEPHDITSAILYSNSSKPTRLQGQGI